MRGHINEKRLSNSLSFQRLLKQEEHRPWVRARNQLERTVVGLTHQHVLFLKLACSLTLTLAVASLKTSDLLHVVRVLF